MTVRAKTLVKDKFWIVEQNGQKLGTLQKKENNGWIYLNKAEKEKIIKLNIKLRFPFLSWLSFLTYLEKSPKLKITIEKYAKTVLVTVINGPKLFLSRKFSVVNNPKNACVVNLTSLSNTDKKNNKIPR